MNEKIDLFLCVICDFDIYIFLLNLNELVTFEYDFLNIIYHKSSGKDLKMRKIKAFVPFAHLLSPSENN